jgi:hypothetical protein
MGTGAAVGTVVEPGAGGEAGGVVELGSFHVSVFIVRRFLVDCRIDR